MATAPSSMANPGIQVDARRASGGLAAELLALHADSLELEQRFDGTLENGALLEDLVSLSCSNRQVERRERGQIEHLGHCALMKNSSMLKEVDQHAREGKLQAITRAETRIASQVVETVDKERKAVLAGHTGIGKSRGHKT